MKNFLIIILLLALIKWYFTDLSISVPTNDVSFSYIVKYSGDVNKNDYLPMLVALHGNGDTAQNFYNTALNEFHVPARIILLQGPLPYDTGNAWPRYAEEFKEYGKALSEAVELLSQKYLTSGKPILLGFSGGGMMAYYQAVKHGNSYSYIFPVSGQMTKKMLGSELSEIGANIHAFHGRNDSVISIGGSKNALKILHEKGAEANLTAFDGNHHGIFTNMKRTIMLCIEEKLEILKENL